MNNLSGCSVAETKTATSIIDQEPVADFCCSNCGYVLAQVYLDAQDRTILIAWNGATGIMTVYKAELTCARCGDAKVFHSTSLSALQLGVLNYG